jgi:hypothetical protein
MPQPPALQADDWWMAEALIKSVAGALAKGRE